MFKRVLSCIVVSIMAITMVSVTTFADEDIWVDEFGTKIGYAYGPGGSVGLIGNLGNKPLEYRVELYEDNAHEVKYTGNGW